MEGSYTRRPPGREGAAACEARLGRLPLATHLLSIVVVLLLPHYYYCRVVIMFDMPRGAGTSV